MKILVPLVLFLTYFTSAYSQRPPDSLFERIAIFKRVIYSSQVTDSNQREYLRTHGEFETQKRYPQASGFYLATDSVLHVVTAGHVINLRDTNKNVMLHFEGGNYDLTIKAYKPESTDVFVRHSDSLVDMIIVNHYLYPGMAKPTSTFHTDDILTKTDFDLLKRGQPVFYIGMFPDSLQSNQLWYWFPPGSVDTIFAKPKIVEE